MNNVSSDSNVCADVIQISIVLKKNVSFQDYPDVASDDKGHIQGTYPRHAKSAVDSSLPLGLPQKNVPVAPSRRLEDFHFLQDHLMRFKHRQQQLDTGNDSY